MALAFVTGRRGEIRPRPDRGRACRRARWTYPSFGPAGAPLLVEHCRSLDALIGQVVAAELDGPLLRAMVRFAPVPEADRVWTLLQAGFPISLSIGATVQQADVVEEHDDCRVIRCGRWTLSEVSVCVYGRDPAAHLRKLNWDEHAGEIVERMQERAGGAKRAAVEGALHLDRWRKWALGAGLGMAEDLGVDHRALAMPWTSV